MINVLSIRYVKVYTMEDIFKKEMITPKPKFCQEILFSRLFLYITKECENAL